MNAAVGPCDLGPLHFMSGWGEPEQLEVEPGIAALVQRRKCTHCNLTQFRKVGVLQ